MSNKNYIIEEAKYYDAYGKLQREVYYIKYKVPFLWTWRWKYIKHIESLISGSYKTRTVFCSIEDAKKFIKNTLCPNKPRQGWLYKDIGEMTCNDK